MVPLVEVLWVWLCWHTPFSPPGNEIADDGAAALAPALKEMTGLKELWLGRKCVIGRR